MSQLPECFQGHDLTGWWVAAGHCILRGTRYCNTMRIWACDDGLFELDILNEVFTPTRASLSECLLDADALAADYGGWAPAPIGSDPGWRYDVESVTEEKKVQILVRDPLHKPSLYAVDWAWMEFGGDWFYYNCVHYPIQIKGEVYAWREMPTAIAAPPRRPNHEPR